MKPCVIAKSENYRIPIKKDESHRIPKKYEIYCIAQNVKRMRTMAARERERGAEVQPMPLGVSFSKAQSSKLERLFCHVSVKTDVRALSFEL